MDVLATLLTEPVGKDSILLHNEASDTNRINDLQFQVVKVKIDSEAIKIEEL